jgi:UDP-2-acetamido-2,6-beta-L-arabino-hexul-4-ose reductase
MDIQTKSLEKHVDSRGYLIEILKDNEITEEIKQVYSSVSKPGAVRGNHYHMKKIEWLSVIRGKARMLCEDNNKKEKEELIISADTPMIIKINPYVSHAIQNIGNEDMYLLVIANKVFDKEYPDVYSVNLL